jgi:Cu(I)/Ag(I) efflux system membrane fusion protein/cobalt-zinc-cadmium efflux system membrane fusion protein
MSISRGVALALLVGIAAGAGWWMRGSVGPSDSAHDGASASVSGGGPCAGGAEPLYWKAPMDPTYIRDQPGKAPMGMDLVPVCGDPPAAGGGGIAIHPGIIQSMGVRMADVERRDLTRTIRAVGRVDYDERLVAHVHTKIQGWIEKLYVEYSGQVVKPGQRLLEIYSPELVSTQEEFLIALRYQEETSGSSFPDVQESGASLLSATRRRLELWDIPDRDIERLLETREIRKTLTLYAPAGGVVTQLMVREGMEVTPNQNLYTISDLSRVWVYANVYEYELPWVETGQLAEVTLSYLPGATFRGEVSYVYPFLEPKTRTARVRIELANPDGLLKPDMYADVRIYAATVPGVLTVPEEALIRSGKRTLAVVALGQGRFEPRPVELGIDSGDGWLEVRSGLREGDRVVTSGQFLIDSESKLQEAVQKLLSRGADDEPELKHAPEAGSMPGMSDDMPGEKPTPTGPEPDTRTGH